VISLSRVVSYSLSKRGIGHASRLVAVHAALREVGWRSLFLVERQQQLIADYGFDQVSVPHYDDSLVGEAPAGIGDPSGRGARVAARIVEACAEPDDLVLHDVVVYRPLYEWARDAGRRQAYISRARKDHDDPVRWVREIAPGITRVFPLGTEEVPDVIRQPLGSKSIWNDAGGVVRVAISAAGGGHADAEDFLDKALAGVASFAQDADRQVSIFVVLGPNFTGRVTLPAGIPGNVSITHYLDPWHSLYNGTDLLICQGGYNTVQELLHHGTAAVTVAGSRPYDDQSARLASIVAQANVRIAQPDAASIAGHLAALAIVARRGMVPPSPPDGARHIAESLVSWD
jgi:hypothetical protein